MKRDPRDNERRLLEIAHTQGGYFTAAQALRSGYSYRQQHFHRERGNWLYIDSGLFRLRSYPDSPHEDLIHWSLWSRNRKEDPQAVVSHETALALYELGDVMPAKIHLTVPPTFRKKMPPGCVFHKARLRPDEIESRPGFFLTTPLKTILDVAASYLSPDLLEGVIDDALKTGMVMKRQLLESDMYSEPRKRIAEALKIAERRRTTYA